MKIFSVQNYYSNQYRSRVSFSSSQSESKPLTAMFHLKNDTVELPWVNNQVIKDSVAHLKTIEFTPEDVKYVQSMGVVLPFLSGADAAKFINDNRIGIKFSKLSSDEIHAQYSYEDNCIKISERYKNTKNPAEVLAISEAILHEAGHAKDKDGETSLQEELDCLAMNTLAHRFLSKKYKDVFLNQTSPIIKEGVNIYPDLFFDEDPLKLALLKRLNKKYGKLPAGDILHSPSPIALKVKELQN